MDHQSSTILVTGGAGYVGSHAILELLKSGYEVVAVDNYSNCYPGKDRSMPESLRRVQNIAKKELIFYEVDLLNRKEVDEVFSKHTFSCVVHFAALKAVGESCLIPLEYYRNNIVGTLNLLEAMSLVGIKKIVFSSSATVYGIPEYLPINEEHPVGTSCTNPYGRSKYFIEEILKDVCKSEKGWSIILLRYFNPVGAHESGDIGEDPRGLPNNLMPYIAQVAIGRRKELEVFGDDYSTCDGTGVRDYIHVVDLAAGHVSAMQYMFQEPFEDCKVFNLGTGQGYSVLRVIQTFESASGIEIPYKIVGRREGDVETMYADVSRAKKYLHWECKYSLFEMCADTWRWQKKNPMGFQETAPSDD